MRDERKIGRYRERRDEERERERERERRDKEMERDIQSERDRERKRDRQRKKETERQRKREGNTGDLNHIPTNCNTATPEWINSGFIKKRYALRQNIRQRFPDLEMDFGVAYRFTQTVDLKHDPAF